MTDPSRDDHRRGEVTSSAVQAPRMSSLARTAVSLRDHGRATVTQIAQASGLSRPTVDSAVTALLQRGLVVEDVLTAGGRGAGRPARSFAFEPSAGYVVGVDAGVHRIRVAVADLGGGVVGWSDEPVSPSLGGAERVQAVRGALASAIAGAGVTRQSVTALGVAVSAYVGREGRVVVSHNTPQWEGVDLSRRIGEGYTCPVVVENDIRLAALAEHRYGAAQLMDDVLYVFAGYRVSLGLIVDGQLRRGHHGACGEVGDLIFSEQVYEDGQLRWSSAPDARSVFRQAAAGHQQSRAEVSQFVDRLSRGLAMAAMTFDPDVIVIGGGLSDAGEELLGPLRRSLQAGIGVPVYPRVVRSELGVESVVLGALARAFEQASVQVFGVSDLPQPSIDTSALPISRTA